MFKEHIMEKDKKVRQLILVTAKKLFVQQGYKKTTIRQIVQKSGVLTGSIYYFFKNKEDIFQSLVMELFRQCSKLIAVNFSNESLAFRYAALCLVEFEAVAMNKLVRETYYEGYTSPQLFEKITEHLTDMTCDLFGEKLVLSREDIFLRSLLIKGAMRSYIVQYDFAATISRQEYAALVIDTSLQLFGISTAERKQTLKQLKERLPEIKAIADEMIHRR